MSVIAHLLQRAVQLRDRVLGLEKAGAGRAPVPERRLDRPHLVLQALVWRDFD